MSEALAYARSMLPTLPPPDAISAGKMLDAADRMIATSARAPYGEGNAWLAALYAGCDARKALPWDSPACRTAVAAFDLAEAWSRTTREVTAFEFARAQVDGRQSAA